MGQEIEVVKFSQQDYVDYLSRLKAETALLATWFTENHFSKAHPVCGFELEAWIIDKNFNPAPINTQLLDTLADPLVTPELASFNLEFNYDPHPLNNHVFTHVQQQMQYLWDKARGAAQALDSDLVMIGVLPTVTENDLTIKNISAMNRYAALNEQVLRLRQGRPLELDIHGLEILRSSHRDVMVESATTSFQIHLQVPLDIAARAYNASIIASAPMVAVAANSPYLFGKDLWSETRIRIFEQAVEVGGYEEGSHGPMRRVTLGSGYVRESLLECFVENLEHYPILLPILYNDDPANLSHLRLHNGTLWRWNRPLIGIGSPTHSLRIEHRVVPAGPTIIDAVANAAFYYGLVYALSCQAQIPEQILGFERARDNFYNAAQLGLDGQMVWLDGNKHALPSLLLKTLLPLAAQGLARLNVDSSEIDLYLGIIQKRVENGCNGCAWQRAFTAKYGRDMHALLAAYLERQQGGEPVHEWKL